MTPEPTAVEVEVEQVALALPDEAKVLTISSDEDFQSASSFLRVRCKTVLKEINAAFDPIIKAVHAAHKEAVAQKKRVSAPVLAAEKVVKGLIADYSRIKEEERRRAEEEARRLARELAEKEALERACDLEANGQSDEAEALIEEPIKPMAVVLPIEKPKAEGVSVRKVYRFRVVDATKINPAFLIPDEKKIGQVVRSMKEEAASIIGDGIEVYCDDVVSARA
jgi:hypothetical protein